MRDAEAGYPGIFPRLHAAGFKPDTAAGQELAAGQEDVEPLFPWQDLPEEPRAVFARWMIRGAQP